MHELSQAGSSRLALSMFGEIADRISLRTIADTAGPLRGEFARLGPVKVLREGRLPRAASRLLGETEAQALVEWTHAQAMSRVLGPGRGSGRPDVVYLNSVAALRVHGHLRRIRRLQCPTILHVHELDVMVAEYERLSPGLFHTSPTHYVAVSEAVAEMLRNRMGIDPELISVIPPQIDQRWLEEPLGGTRGRRAEATVVGGVGIPGWTKGGDLWLLTAAELARRYGRDRFHFRWFGLDSGFASAQLRAMAQKLELEGLVELLPFTDDPASAYRSMDLLLMSSWEESASLVTLEAMAMRRPVACFAGSGGPPELVADTGIVVDGFSPSAMADAIAEAAESPDSLQLLGLAARRRVASQFSGEGRSELLLDLLEAQAVG
jgi:glycosyltransferase involved in cell wall biosynthesis